MDRQEALQRSQSGEKPSGGYYTSSERITLRNFGLGRITRISSSKFAGSGGGRGRGGAIVPLNRSIDSSALVSTAQVSQIDPNIVFSLQKQINALAARDEQQLALNNNIIGTLQNQFQILQARVVDLGSQLLGVRNALISDANLERKQEVEEQNLEKKQIQQQYRTEKENLIEKKIVSALMAPIKAIGERVQLTLARLMQFFGVLFAGWLVDKAIETFRALSTGNTEKLESIKNSVLKNLGIVAGILLALNGGFLVIAKIISSLALRVGGFILKNTVGKFFGMLANAAKGLLGIGKQAVPAAAGAGAAAAGLSDDAAKVAGKGAGGVMASVTGVGKNLFKIGGKALPFVGSAFYGADAAQRFNMGDWGGAALSAIGAVTSFGGPIAGLAPAAIQMATDAAGLTGEKSVNKQETVRPISAAPRVTPTTPSVPQNIKPPTITPSTSTQVAPQTSTVPSADQYQINTNNITQTSYNTDIDFRQPAQFGEVSVPVTDGEVPSQPAATSPTSLTISPAQTQRIPSSTRSISPEPEAKPNIVYMSSGGGKPQMPKISERSGAASEVPFIPSGNPDNFYLLYSQVSYNVVM